MKMWLEVNKAKAQVTINVSDYGKADRDHLDAAGVTDLRVGFPNWRYRICNSPAELQEVRDAVCSGYSHTETTPGNEAILVKNN